MEGEQKSIGKSPNINGEFNFGLPAQFCGILINIRLHKYAHGMANDPTGKFTAQKFGESGEVW